MRRFLIPFLLLACVAGCAQVEAQELAPQEETWVLLFDRTALEVCWSHLDADDIEAATLKGVQQRYGRWSRHIKFVMAEEDNGAANVCMFHCAPEAIPQPVIGLAVHIDEWNLNTERMVGIYGVYTDHLAAALSYHLLLKNPRETPKPTVEEVSYFLAHTAAHEIGHCLGMYHIHSPVPYIMTAIFAGSDEAGWSPQSKCYLDRVLVDGPSAADKTFAQTIPLWREGDATTLFPRWWR